MREILFRGKEIGADRWVHGSLDIHKSGVVVIMSDEIVTSIYARVDPDTVGQYTGLTDKNGKKIFEGDLVRVEVAKIDFVAVCKFYSGSFGLVWHYMGAERYSAFTGMCHVEYEVIGNIHDNPELMEGERHG